MFTNFMACFLREGWVVFTSVNAIAVFGEREYNRCVAAKHFFNSIIMRWSLGLSGDKLIYFLSFLLHKMNQWLCSMVHLVHTADCQMKVSFNFVARLLCKTIFCFSRSLEDFYYCQFSIISPRLCGLNRLDKGAITYPTHPSRICQTFWLV